MSYFDDNEASIVNGPQRKPKVRVGHIIKEIEKTENDRIDANFIGDREEFKRLTHKLIRLWKSINMRRSYDNEI